MSHFEVLDAELRCAEIDLPLPQKLKLAVYCDELARWNQKVNLTGLSGANMVRRLVVEPVWIGRQLNPGGILVDVGSGNGSPAIPLRIVCGLEACRLIEVRTKRAVFLRYMVAELKLEGTYVHKTRFEEGMVGLGVVDWITLQGVALGDKLIDSIRAIATPTTTIVWITAAGAKSPLKPSRVLRVPFTNTEVLCFRLDLS